MVDDDFLWELIAWSGLILLMVSVVMCLLGH
jgi:hypothetical protein